MNIFRVAYIYIQDTYTGILEETDEGYRFTYDSDYLAQENPQNVSITLPLQKDSYLAKVLFPFFDGLIPEGWLLDVVTRNWKIDVQDRFGLLLVACNDCIGNVSVRREKT